MTQPVRNGKEIHAGSKLREVIHLFLADCSTNVRSVLSCVSFDLSYVLYHFCAPQFRYQGSIPRRVQPSNPPIPSTAEERPKSTSDPLEGSW